MNVKNRLTSSWISVRLLAQLPTAVIDPGRDTRGRPGPAVVAAGRLRDPVGLRLGAEGRDLRAIDAVLRGDAHLVDIGIRGELRQRGNAGLPAEATDARCR